MRDELRAPGRAGEALNAPTFQRRWAEAVAAAPGRPFLVFEDRAGLATAWTYAEFDALAARVAAGLAARGLRPGGRLHLALANSPAFVAAWLAAARLGAAIVPSDPQSSARELAVHLERTRPAVGLCARERREAYRAAATPGLEVVELDEDDVELAGLCGPRGADPVPVEAETPAAVMFTSGTTSAPKGVVVTQANYAFTGDVMAAAAALTAADRQLVVLPLFHGNAQYYSFAAAISAGASVALASAFSASRFLEQARRYEATHASLFAAPMRMILARGATPVAGLRLRNVWFAQNLAGEQYEMLALLFGCRPRQIYGMTETIPAVLSNPALDPVRESIGQPTPGCEVDLWAEGTTEPVADGEVGEIVVGGRRGLTLFAGYLDDPETTERAFSGRFFRTGDLARRDAEGRYYFTGRHGDVLKVSGENVSTVEVEAVLAEHPAVLEAAVVGEPDEVRDEVPVAYVVLAPGGQASVEELAGWCAARLAPVKRPRRIDFVEELPRTSVGKVRKFLLGPGGG